MNLIEKYRARLNDARHVMGEIETFLSTLNEKERFIFEERAGIMEFDGGLTREEAEQRAMRHCKPEKKTGR